MKKLLYGISILCIALVSCEQDAHIKLPETEPELVISCYITPQDAFIRAMITKSNPVFNTTATNTGAPVTNATVTLYGNSTSIQLIYNTQTEYYEVPATSFSIIPGNEYHIVVTEPGGLRAEGYTTVPTNAPSGFQCSATDTMHVQQFYSYGESRFEYSFNDPGGQNNYYRFVAYNMMVDSFSGDTLIDRSCWDLFTDENADGSTITYHSYGGYSTNYSRLVGYDVWMLNCNYDYYMFHQSIYNYSGDDPFSEPTQIYSNITDGLGIFAAANSTRIRIPR